MKRSGMKAKFSPTQVAQVSHVEFVAFSQQLLQNWGVTQITQSQLYQGSKPTKKSPNDLRLGISTQDQKCQTCGQTKQCQGHFGFIKLEEPVYHYGYLKYIEKILKCVCHKCYRVKRPNSDQQWKKFNAILKIENHSKKLNEMAKLLHNIKQCPPKHNDKGQQFPKNLRGCGSPIPTRVSLKNYRVLVQDLNTDINKKTKTYERGEVRKILQQLSKNKDDCKILGFYLTKPIDLMIRTLAVPPPQIRPSIEMNPERKAEDDITSAYVRIIDMNQDIKHDNFQYSDKASKIDDLERMIASIMIKLDRHKLQKTSTSTSNKKRAIKNIKSISDRLKGKEGRFRQNLMGKRVDFSARSVVSPDSNLALDELGVPQKVAHKLTVPEEVTKWNYDRIISLCRAGKVHVLLKPAQDRLRDDDKPINVQKIEDSQIEKYVNYGMIAQRCLQDGDYVLFNRQPTLHRMSMMGHRVRILPYNTFRLNLSVCTPYNADFDGDEMNMHVPQTFETISQLKNIAHVPKQIVAPKNNAPIMGIVQDALLGIFLFTMRDTFLTRQQIMNLVIWIQGKDGNSGYFQNFLPGQLPIPAILKPQPLWTGKQVMSLIIPKKITIQIFKGQNKNDSQSNIKDVSMIIKKGQLLSGALQKQIVGSGAGGLVHSIWLQIGPDATNQFITIAQRIVNNWLISNSFTVGAADIVPDNALQNIIDKERISIQNLYYKVLNQYRNTQIIQEENLHQKGKKILDSFEFYTNSKLNNQLGKAQKIIKQKVSPYHNNIFKMITAKSKGSETNLCQIMFLVGNQNVDGKRCPLGFAKRALPHFRKDDNSPQPRGFVFSSFYTGLKPHQFFFHAMGGREGLSDTAVKTSRTGYIQRKLVKSLQDLIVKYDGTIRDSKNNFLQKLYGQDGFTPQYIQNHKFIGAQLSQIDFKQRYRWDDSFLLQQYNYQKNDIIKMNEEYEKLKDARLRMRQIFVTGRDSTTIQYYCPIKIERLVNKIKATNYGIDKQIVQPLYVYQKVQKLIQKCVPPQSLQKYTKLLQQIRNKNMPFKKAFQKVKEFQRQNGIELFRIHLRHNLASRVLCDKFKLTKAAFNGLIQQVQTKFYQALIPAGQSIGSIAAQSIGQPTTQMTLNTFHLAGVSDKNVTLGVPRLQQLLDSSKNIKTPGMIIHLKNKILFKDKGITQNQKRILQISQYYLPQRTIKHYIEASRFYYDPQPTNSRIGFHTNQHNEKKKTPWVINLEFSHKKMIKRLWDQILNKFQQQSCQSTPLKQLFQIQQHVDFNEVDDSRNPQIILRLYQVNDMNFLKKDQKDPLSYLSKKQSQIKFTKVGGISGIKTVKTNKKLMLNVNQNHSLNLSDSQKKQFQYIVFQTDGSNLKQCLSHRDFDSRKTTCNDMTQIYKVLGIQAARQSFINQFKQIIKPYGIYVNYHHLSILTDWMSMRGTITPVNRNGINRVKDISVLRKASYQQTAQILFGAAAFSQRDNLKGISQKIIFGQPVQIGTSSFKIMIDCEKVGNYSTKAQIDKKQAIGLQNSVQYIPGINPQITPLMMNTPMVHGHGGTSVISSPGRLVMSPAFTPARRPQLFTPSYDFDAGFSAQRSPMQTPLPYQTPLQQTPNYSNPMKDYNSPLIGNSSYYNRNQTSNMRSPYYYPGAASSSPNYNYSSIRQMSQSPDYNNSPLNSNYSSSPNYGMGNDSGRQPNYKQEEDHEDQDQF